LSVAAIITDEIMRRYVSHGAEKSQAKINCPIKNGITQTTAVYKGLLNTPLMNDRIFKEKAE
jgi:hypothetical protein